MNRDLDAPRGWAVNPSAAAQRAPVVVLAAIGLALALLHVLEAAGSIHPIWEPFAVVDRNGWVLATPRVPLPVVDVIGFAAILATAFIGGSDRWRRRPLLAMGHGLVTIAVASCALLRWALQYASTAMTSTSFCVLVASAVACVPCALDELYASASAERDIVHASRGAAPYRRMRESRSVVRVGDWSGYAAGVGAIVLGVALLFAARWSPPHAAVHARFVGGLVAAIGALSLPQVSRWVRWMNAGIGAWLLVAPLLHGYAVGGAILAVVFGSLLLLVTVGLGDPVERHGPSAGFDALP